MKIVLISTLTGPSNLGLAILSSVLKKAGYDVTMVFMATNKLTKNSYNKKELKQLELICEGCDLVGISSFTATSKRTIQIIDFLKGKVPNMVWGGVHATLYPEDCIKYCDIVCVGEGEEAILDLAKAIEKNKPIDNIKNLWIKKDNKIIRNPIRNMINDLDKIPFPDFEIEKQFVLKNGKLKGFEEKDFGGLIIFMAGRGCPYGCDYCSNNVFNRIYEGKRECIVRKHSIYYVIDVLDYIKNKYPNVKNLEISDDSFSLIPIKEIKEFGEKYKKRVGLKFYCLIDARTLTEEKAKLLVDAGCQMVTIGIQSSERVNRQVYHRYITDEDVLRSSKILKSVSKNLATTYDIITCNPYEKPEDIIALINLLRKIPKPYRLSVSALLYFPGTNITNRALKDKLITEKDLFQEDTPDRMGFLLKRKKNLYLNLISTLMGGLAIDNKVGLINDSWFDYLLDEKRIEKNLKNPFFVILFIRFFRVRDFVRNNIVKKIIPESFKRRYIEIRLKNKILYNPVQN